MGSCWNNWNKLCSLWPLWKELGLCNWERDGLPFPLHICCVTQKRELTATERRMWQSPRCHQGISARFIPLRRGKTRLNVQCITTFYCTPIIKWPLCWVLHACSLPYLHRNSRQMQLPHFTQDKTEAQRDWVLYPRFLSMKIAEMESNPVVWLHAISTILHECRWSPLPDLVHRGCWRNFLTDTVKG